MYKDFSDWELFDGFLYGSGTSKQEWIVNIENGSIGLFKDRKSEQTTDNFSEKIASEIADIIELPCAKIDLAIRNGRVGMVSYKINSESENIIEGIQFISTRYPKYNRDTLEDEESGEKYSLDIILNSINGLNIKKDLFKIFIFDFLIGNTDRHHSNWAILMNNDTKEYSICPVYDNASSLCSYVNDDIIKRSINDNVWLNSQFDSKSKSLIRIDGKKVRHSDFVRYLKENFYLETIDFVKQIKLKFTDNIIDELLDSYNKLLSNEKISLLKIYLKNKVKILMNIYEIS
ncbi:HipA domain-containing protein [Clostridium perfringens]|uniref:HipA domain-containing protein n=1 Tax=Clostridium perfringens TaxID=1502 RepID=UPI001A1D8A7F|nr:HipA domain-containing protein [Clostridium perfringens]MBO3304630.1 HipA domain-containing protein [Clostridium perfringens]MBO3307949.1 HipA domain-containing protein [Clostridium perfringens]MBO3311293.1 HipA domain-containing protein [Clostridium perfringens]MBO3317628.1 HipA domain-containing protein [Clostridium perfringens]MBO3392744.1 HipA domain-containing protein [Clostridium perfringens]